jgi:hypothetical protein
METDLSHLVAGRFRLVKSLGQLEADRFLSAKDLLQTEVSRFLSAKDLFQLIMRLFHSVKELVQLVAALFQLAKELFLLEAELSQSAKDLSQLETCLFIKSQRLSSLVERIDRGAARPPEDISPKYTRANRKRATTGHHTVTIRATSIKSTHRSVVAAHDARRSPPHRHDFQPMRASRPCESLRLLPAYSRRS